MPWPRFLPELRTVLLLLFAALLTGCASMEAVRGELHLDLRPQDKRTDLVWPQPPDPPRYRYVGELIGEQNFKPSTKTRDNLSTAFKWVVGLFEEKEWVMLHRPQHGVVGNDGRIYVVDAGHNALLVFDPNPPEDGILDDKDGQLLIWGGRESKYNLGTPMAVAIAWNGEIAVSDAKNGAVVLLDTKGEFIREFGVGQLKRPTGLAFDRKRALLFVSDTEAHDIKVYDGNGNLVEVIGGPGENEGLLNAPTHLAFAGGHLYVTDTYNSRIQIFDSQGKRVGGFGERGLYIGNMARPKGVAVDDKGIVYVIESYFGFLLAYNDKSELLMGIRGTGAKDDRFLLPSGVWTDDDRRVYVADMFNGRVVVFQLLESTE